MRRHCQEDRRKKSVRLSPSVEALECRKLLSGPGPGTPPVPDNGMAWLPRPLAATEVIKVHKVVVFQVRFAVDVSLPPTGDIQQYCLEPAGSVRPHLNAYGPLGVPLASVTYDQADMTLRLAPTAPARVRKYRLVKQGSFGGPPLPGDQVTWSTLVKPPSPPHQSQGSSDWYDYLNPLAWPALLVCAHGC
jgi:hypothetical protein